MKSFSQRKGLKPAKSVIQVDSMDDDLKNRLWNALTMFYWDKVEVIERGGFIKDITPFQLLWDEHFREPLDEMYPNWLETLLQIRDRFFNYMWNEVYDFVEFVANRFPNKPVNSAFMVLCNSILKEELSAYRFVGGLITPITTQEEITEIEEALSLQYPLKLVANHIRSALDLFSNKKSPDYRNSIKESISAVEALCKLIAGKRKATLEQALKEIEKKVSIHTALKQAFIKLYGYTSDADGIRHALLDEPNLDSEDAKFMLVSCSAFTNYLISKSCKAGIKL